MKTLVIAEKPSVAQDIVKALTPTSGKFEKHDDHFENDQYVVTSAVGHLVEIQAPEQYDVKRGKWSFANLPVIPPHFDLKPVDKTKSRLTAVVRQAKRKDIDALINACDAGREGELIFRLIEQYAGGAKPLNKPVKRLWLQSMTPQAIRDGFDALRSEQQMAGLASAARSRGRGGGMRLMKAPAEINLGAVVRQTETDFHLVECFDPNVNQCRLSGNCRLKGVLGGAINAYLAVLDGVTLADLVDAPNPKMLAQPLIRRSMRDAKPVTGLPLKD